MNTFKKMKSIKSQLIIIILITSILIICGVLLSSIYTMRNSLYREKSIQLKEIVDSNIGTIKYYYELEKQGELSRAQAQEMAKEILENSFYGDQGNDYFWIINYKSEMVMHPLNKNLNGQDVSQITDENGVRIFEKMVGLAKIDGSGFLEYGWQYYDDQQRVETKLSYVKGFDPWGWALGTGIYINDINDTIYDLITKIILIGILILFLVNILIYYFINKALNPIHRLTDKIGSFDINNFNSFDNTIENTRFEEINLLLHKYNQMIRLLKDNFKEKEEINWLANSQNELNNETQGIENIQYFAKQIITKLTKEIGGQIGTFYVYQEDNEDISYKLIANYAYTRRKSISDQFKLGEGLVGQAALEQDMIVLSELPDDYVTINSSLGKQKPKNIVILPCVYNGEVKAVIEIGSIREFKKVELELLNQVSSNIGISVTSFINYSKIEKLLEKTNEQKEELRMQQEELRVNNEELEEKSRKLQVSEAKLQTQQEELRVSNEELEEKNNKLEQQAVEVEEKNQELEKTKRIIEQKMEELKDSNKYKSEFLANMSHELRTPLNSILILSELLANNRNNNLNDKDIEFASTIHSAGEDLLTLINDILDLSKIEAGHIDVNIERVNFDELVTNMKHLFNQFAIEKGIDFKINVDSKLPKYIETDRQKLEQIIKNLLSNAFKFTEEGKVTLDICTTEDHKVSFAVNDTGIGIDVDKKDIIFEAFQQADGATNRKYGGTGLGLPISKKYSMLLGGDIKLESTKNVGSTFTVKLPYNLEKDDEKKLSSVAENDEKVKYTSENQVNNKSDLVNSKYKAINNYIPDDREMIKREDKSLLIIEDDSNFAITVANLSREKGFKVLIAETGEDGLYLADYYLPDAIILDVGLPGIDGWEVKNRLKANQRTKDIIIHIISGAEKDESKSLKGVLKYLQKPVNVRDINKVLDNIEENLDKSVRKLLVVEDNYVQRNSMVEYIRYENRDVEISTASSAKEAYEHLINDKFDLMILDLGLGKDNTFELIEKIRKDKSLSNIPIVVYTGQDITQAEEFKLRGSVEKIIIKGEKSSKRLIDEINLFLHKVNQENNQEDKLVELDELSIENKTILVVDDDMRNVFAISSILEEEGIKVVVASNGKEGIDKLKENNEIDLIIMDIMMPKMDGYEAIRRIRSEDQYKSLPIIALTAKAMRQDKEKCIKAGANDYLSKPLEKDKLFSLLRVWLQK